MAWARLRLVPFWWGAGKGTCMTVTLNYLNRLVNKAGCMDTNTEVRNAARKMNVFAQQLELLSSRSMGWTSSRHISVGCVRVRVSNPPLSQRIGRQGRVYGYIY